MKVSHLVVKAHVGVKWPHGSERAHAGKGDHKGEGAQRGKGAHRSELISMAAVKNCFSRSAREHIYRSSTFKTMAPPVNVVQ